MRHYIGLDISNKETSICIINENNKVIKQFKANTDPDSIAQAIKKTGLDAALIGLETGNLSHWLVEGLKKYYLPVKCIDSRRMSAIIQTNVNKTDRNDAKEIARAMKSGNYREIHHKTRESVDISVLMTTRGTLVHELGTLRNTVRGLLKIYGVKLKTKLKNEKFIEEVEGQLSWDNFLPEQTKPKEGFEAIRSLLSCITKLMEELEKLEQRIEVLCENNKLIAQFETIPAIGKITALSYIISMDDPTRFKYSRSVGAFYGLTPRQYSSGESTKQGKISKCGPKDTRALLVGAGMTILTRTTKWSKLKAFGMKVLRKTGSKQKAAVAIARKLAIIMHRMWIQGTEFVFGEPKNKKELNEIERLQNLAFASQKKKAKNKREKSKIAA